MAQIKLQREEKLDHAGICRLLEGKQQRCLKQENDTFYVLRGLLQLCGEWKGNEEGVKSRDKRGKTNVVMRQDMMVFGWDGGRRNRDIN